MTRRSQPAKDMCNRGRYDAVVVGSGPNGMACAIKMLQSGHSVLLVEAQALAGGGCRTLEMTLPGFKHDVCSAIHPLGLGSPYFRTLQLERFGLEWVNPNGAYAHALSKKEAVLVSRSIEETAARMASGGAAYARLFNKVTPPDWNEVCEVLLNPPKVLRHARHALDVSFFGAMALQSAAGLARHAFASCPEAKAVFGGIAAHASTSLQLPASAALGLVLGITAHAVGWPMPRGGAQSLTNALMSCLESLGGEVVLSCEVQNLHDLPECRYLFLDVTPRQLLNIAGEYLPTNYVERLRRYKYGPSCFKMDWALSEPIPWSAPELFEAPTVHLGGTFEEIAAAEQAVWKGRHAEKPYVLLTQPSLFDETRCPPGYHTAWAYCHVPFASEDDRTDAIESRIEQFAPGFKKTILARSMLSPHKFESVNANHVGGDINGGTLAMPQLLFRPVITPIPYATPLPNTYLCSSSTPPGSGVHGMCGYYAALTALASPTSLNMGRASRSHRLARNSMAIGGRS